MANTPGVADHAAPPPARDVIVGLIDTVAAEAVEPKVKAATAAGAGAAGIVLPALLWLMSAYLFDGDVPAPVQALVGFAVTGVCTFVGGYYARHVDRAAAAS